MLKVKVIPEKNFLIDYLSRHDVKLVEENPDIIHFFGDDAKDLKKLIRDDNPDLVINHVFPSFKIKDQFQVFHPVEEESDLIRAGKALTNAYPACKRYYEIIGLQAEIKSLPKEKRKAKHEHMFGFADSYSGIWKRFKHWMVWE